MSKFQIIVLGVFVLAIIVGVAVFATYKGRGGSSTQLPPITVWGTFPAETFNSYISKINQTFSLPLSISYTEISPNSFSQQFIAALARGTGPDAILISADMILPHLDKITPIPYEALPQRTFMDSYINEAQIYVGNDGILAIPFVVDPLLMYWNKDMFASANIATYPRYWDDFTELNKKLTIKDNNGNIRKSAIAMGDFVNIANAREILGTLILQLGNPVTMKNQDGYISSTINTSGSVNPISAVQYFTQFANPNSSNYSWNRGMQNSKTAFLSGTLATYFGFASELKDIRAKNPNLNFDVAVIPQMKVGGMKASYGKLYGFSVVKASTNQNAAYQTFTMITNPNSLRVLRDMTYLPSISIDLIAEGSKDPYITVFNGVALIAKTWLDADPIQSNRIFGNMVDAITSGAKNISEAINDTGDQYDVLLYQATQ